MRTRMTAPPGFETIRNAPGADIHEVSPSESLTTKCLRPDIQSSSSVTAAAVNDAGLDIWQDHNQVPATLAPATNATGVTMRRAKPTRETTV
jgi:hypothetical protein